MVEVGKTINKCRVFYTNGSLAVQGVGNAIYKNPLDQVWPTLENYESTFQLEVLGYTEMCRTIACNRIIQLTYHSQVKQLGGVKIYKFIGI